MDVDRFSYLEDLEGVVTIRFIERHNRRLRSFLGGLPTKLYPRIDKYFGVEQVIQFMPTDRGVYVLSRDREGYKVSRVSDEASENVVSSSMLGDNAVIAGIYPHPDRDMLGVFYTLGGGDEGYLKIFDESSLEVVDSLEGSIWNLVWVDSDTYYYVRFYRYGYTPDGVEAPASRVYRRGLEGYEELVFGEGLATNNIIQLHRDLGSSWLYVTVSRGWVESRIYGGVVDEPSSWGMIFFREGVMSQPISHLDGVDYVIVYDGGGNGRVLAIEGRTSVRELIPENGYPLRGGVVFGNTLLLNYLVHASSRLRTFSLDGSLVIEYVSKDPVYISMVRAYGDRVYMLVRSFSTPQYLARFDDSGFEAVYGGREVIELEVSEEFIKSEDGVDIHIFKIRDPKADERGCAIVYGYGGFSIPLTPMYLGHIIPYLEDGWVFIMANLRGGGEYGEEWHRMGMKRNKINVFKDFKSVISWVKGNGYKVVAWGGSNGGLLVGATFTLYPGLIDIAVIGYPVLDMLRFHKLYIGRLWTTEYGDPDDPRDRAYLMQYSPYHSLRPGMDYPSTLVYTGLHDDRVHPAHAFKFVARMEELGYDVYLRVETESGHLGASPETKVSEYADIMAFIYRKLGIV